MGGIEIFYFVAGRASLAVAGGLWLVAGGFATGQEACPTGTIKAQVVGSTGGIWRLRDLGRLRPGGAMGGRLLRARDLGCGRDCDCVSVVPGGPVVKDQGGGCQRLSGVAGAQKTGWASVHSDIT